MGSNTIKFDVINASNIYKKIEKITQETEDVIKSCEKEFNSSLDFFKGKSRKIYEEESTELFEDFRKVIKETSNMSKIVEDVSKEFLDFDVANSKVEIV